MSINKNKRKGESLNSPLPSKKQGFKTVLPKRGKNRRKLETSDIPSNSNVDITSSPIELSNQFDLINDEIEQIEFTFSPGDSIHAKKQRIPPIVVSVAEFSGFRNEILSNLQGIKVSFQIARKGDCRVLPGSFDDRKRLLQYLTEKRHKFFTYDDKTERLFKVVLKGLPSDDKSLDEIKIEISQLLGFSPVQVIKMKKKSRRILIFQTRPPMQASLHDE